MRQLILNKDKETQENRNFLCIKLKRNDVKKALKICIFLSHDPVF